MATLAPPLSSTRSRKERLAPPRPSPAGARPVKHRMFPLMNLVKVPLRVLSPPKATGMVGSVRSLKSTPLNDVKLADVIANKHLSPLSLKDFEGYLVFKEYSAENLYFILWLNEYEKEYSTYLADPSVPKPEQSYSNNTDPLASRTADHLPEYLSDSLRRGLDVFFAPDGALELNLPRAVRDKTLVDAGNSGSPKDFAEARDIIEHSLNQSLSKHAKASVANAGPRRLVFCFCLGLSIFLLGLVPPLVAILTNHARGYRVIGLPFIAFGTAVMVMALKQICGVIWLLGEDRQLLPWELASPTVTSGSIVPMSSPRASSVDGSWDGESSIGYDEKSPDNSFQTQTSASPYPWEKQSHATDSVAPAEHTISFTPDSSRPPSYKSGGTVSRGVVPDSSPVWAPVCCVFSKDIARAQWRIAAFSLVCGVIMMCTLGAVLMAVPNRSP
ncbi:uncharacterized protein JCM6883_004891 [Sporobolomyces salmoneus]|uniref:uncharacterized protein n=1 Tax=Sporobolomyces salmoneus TaxID=183962 RepID=UPI0031796B01